VLSSRQKQKLVSIFNHLPFITKSKKYCVTASDEYKFVWYRVAKVGTRTILSTMKDANVSLSVENAYKFYTPSGEYDDYFKFAFVRNPFDRLVSCWLNKVHNREDNRFGVNPLVWNRMKTFTGFIDFVETLDLEACDVHLRRQASLIDLSNIDYIGRMENFEADVDEVFRHLGIKNEELVVRNVTNSRKHYQEYYNQADVERVRKLYQKDCQIFGYSF